MAQALHALTASIKILAWVALFRLGLYVGVAGGMHIFVWRIRRAQNEPKKLQAAPFQSKDIVREIKYSVLTELLFAFLLAMPWVLLEFKSAFAPVVDLPFASMVYLPPGEHGTLWLIASFFLLLIIHDAWHYWKHVLMHRFDSLRRFHQVHHDSFNPMALASFSFHPLESFLEGIWLMALFFILPLNWYVILAFTSLFTLVSAVAHLGLEVYPRWWLTIPILRSVNDVTSHNQHHVTNDQNFGLYFKFWDKLMGTSRTDNPAADFD